jgi:hypothetical protein
MGFVGRSQAVLRFRFTDPSRIPKRTGGGSQKLDQYYPSASGVIPAPLPRTLDPKRRAQVSAAVGEGSNAGAGMRWERLGAMQSRPSITQPSIPARRCFSKVWRDFICAKNNAHDRADAYCFVQTTPTADRHARRGLVETPSGRSKLLREAIATLTEGESCSVTHTVESLSLGVESPEGYPSARKRPGYGA